MPVERDADRPHAPVASAGDRGLEHRPVAQVHAVEEADRHHRRLVRQGQRLDPVHDLHRARAYRRSTVASMRRTTLVTAVAIALALVACQRRRADDRRARRGHDHDRLVRLRRERGDRRALRRGAAGSGLRGPPRPPGRGARGGVAGARARAHRRRARVRGQRPRVPGRPRDRRPTGHARGAAAGARPEGHRTARRGLRAEPERARRHLADRHRPRAAHDQRPACARPRAHPRRTARVPPARTLPPRLPLDVRPRFRVVPGARRRRARSPRKPCSEARSTSGCCSRATAASPSTTWCCSRTTGGCSPPRT